MQTDKDMGLVSMSEVTANCSAASNHSGFIILYLGLKMQIVGAGGTPQLCVSTQLTDMYNLHVTTILPASPDMRSKNSTSCQEMQSFTSGLLRSYAKCLLAGGCSACK